VAPEGFNTLEVEETTKTEELSPRPSKFLGKRWNGVLLGTLTNGPSGFAELKRNVEGISDSVLSERLSELQEAARRSLGTPVPQFRSRTNLPTPAKP